MSEGEKIRAYSKKRRGGAKKARYEALVMKLKKRKNGVENPWALAHHIQNKGG